MINMTIKPVTEIIVSSTVQIWKVCLTDKSKNSLKIQNPASLTWEAINDPAPMANATNTGNNVFPGLAAKIPVTIPAAVIPATVAEPTVRRPFH